MNLLNVNLPKWPALVVRGKPVTKEQAAEILIRTDAFYFSCNDREWVAQLKEAAGINDGDWESITAARERYGVLDIQYLNNWQIASSWIGGPKGWCSWDGFIGCNTFNIGKWPTAEGVLEEWEAIASAFPYLSLRSQLFDTESGEPEGKPVIEYIVEDGTVSIVAPTEPVDAPRPLSEQQMASTLFVPARIRERGCTIETFKWALEIAAENSGLLENV